MRSIENGHGGNLFSLFSNYANLSIKILFQHCATIMVETTQNPASTPSSCRHVLRGNGSSSRRYPYFIPSGRLRRNSVDSSSTCSSSSIGSSSSSSCCSSSIGSSSSEYSQPSPSYSITSYESLSPEPQVSSCTAADCYSPHVVPLSPATAATRTFRSAEREAQVFERLRQLVPVLPSDRSAYQVRP